MMSARVGRWSLATVAALLVCAPASAHVEREPVFVDPAADTGILPAAGGDYVAVREITDPAKRLRGFRAYVRRAYRGKVTGAERERLLERFTRLSARQQASALRYVSGMRARVSGRPTPAALGLMEPRLQAEETLVVCRPDSLGRLRTSLAQQTRLSRAAKRRALALHRSLFERCRFGEIQAAVSAAGNGDTVAVMPGFYTEPSARAKPHGDPACASLIDPEGSPTYEYHAKCPNDLNLVALIGRDLQGKCIRCNVQIIGTGARPEDVLLEGAKDARDPGVTGDLWEEGRGQIEAAKELGIRIERGDGAVISNLTVRNVSEHGVYSIETDGATFDRLKLFYGHEYGHLSFVTDHAIVQDTEAAGSSDAGLYPGASPPSRPRINTIVRNNYSHHNSIGLSGTMGSNVRVTNNLFTENSTGAVMDSLTRSGHPGFPQNSSVYDNNRIHSNNFDTYSEKAWVRSSTPAPIGAGIILAGGNDNLIRDNHIYDNWRYGTVLLSVPDALSTDTPGAGDARFSTSHRNRNESNVYGIAPDGSELPNGIDLWWDEMGQANCWQSNRGPGPDGALVTDPPDLPDCDDFPNLGATPNPAKESMLLACYLQERKPGQPGCDWYEMPPKPEPR